jgi:Restriction endonuclease
MKTHSPDCFGTNIGSSPNVQSSFGNVLIALHERLLSLPYDAYLQVITLLLSRLGYQDICPSGRLDWKGRNKGGGYDLTATMPNGFHPMRVVITAKQFDRTSRIFQRQVDELRGAALRSGANEALLITSGTLSPAIDHEGISSSLAPVRLMDGDELISLLIQHGIGITDSFGLDEALFTKLEQEAIGNRQSDCMASSDLLLTVSLNRVPKERHDPVPKRGLPVPKDRSLHVPKERQKHLPKDRSLAVPKELPPLRRQASKLRRLSKSG